MKKVPDPTGHKSPHPDPHSWHFKIYDSKGLFVLIINSVYYLFQADPGESIPEFFNGSAWRSGESPHGNVHASGRALAKVSQLDIRLYPYYELPLNGYSVITRYILILFFSSMREISGLQRSRIRQSPSTGQSAGYPVNKTVPVCGLSFFSQATFMHQKSPCQGQPIFE